MCCTPTYIPHCIYLMNQGISERGGRQWIGAIRYFSGPPVIKTLCLSSLIHRRRCLKCKEQHNCWTAAGGCRHYCDSMGVVPETSRDREPRKASWLSIQYICHVTQHHLPVKLPGSGSHAWREAKAPECVWGGRLARPPMSGFSPLHHARGALGNMEAPPLRTALPLGTSLEVPSDIQAGGRSHQWVLLCLPPV